MAANESRRFRYTGDDEKDPYHYTECGLDNVFLVSGYDLEETEEGPSVSVKCADDLLRAIGRFLASEKKLLSGKELRFLRNQMDLTQAELAKLVGTTDQSVARWEKDICSVPGAADYLIRVLYLEHAHENVSVRDLLEALEERDEDEYSQKSHFYKSAEGWKPRMIA